MKKCYKLLAVCVAVVLVVCCCCIPASAATINTKAKFDFAVFRPYSYQQYYDTGNYDSYWAHSVYVNYNDTNAVYFCSPFEYTLKFSDTISWNAFEVSIWNCGDTALSLYGFSFCLLDQNYNEVLVLNSCNTAATNLFWQGNFKFSGGSLSVGKSSVDVKYIALRFDATNYNLNGNILYFTDYTIDFSVVDALGSQIENLTAEQEKTNEYLGEITADKYTPPSGGDDVGNVGAVEEGILEDSAEGLNSANDAFKAFSLDTFTDSLGGLVTIYNHIIPQTPWLYEILNISLALGLFAFLCGSMMIVVGRISPKPEKPHPRQDAKYRKVGGIASHRPSRRR